MDEYVSTNSIERWFYIAFNIISLAVLLGSVIRSENELKDFEDDTSKKTISKTTNIYNWVGVALASIVFLFAIIYTIRLITKKKTLKDLQKEDEDARDAFRLQQEEEALRQARKNEGVEEPSLLSRVGSYFRRNPKVENPGQTEVENPDQTEVENPGQTEV